MPTKRSAGRGTAIYGPSLLALREKSGLSRRAVADEVGISVSYLHRIETSDESTVSTPIAVSLARVLDVEPAAITRPVVLVASDDADGWPA